MYFDQFTDLSEYITQNIVTQIVTQIITQIVTQNINKIGLEFQYKVVCPPI